MREVMNAHFLQTGAGPDNVPRFAVKVFLDSDERRGWRRREALSARDGTCGGSGLGRSSGCPGLWPGVGRACEAPSFQAVAVTAFAVKVFLDSDERRVGDDARRCRRETVLAAVRDSVDLRAAPVYGPVSAAPAKRRRFRRSRSRHFGQGRARSGRSAGGCGSIAVHFA